MHTDPSCQIPNSAVVIGYITYLDIMVYSFVLLSRSGNLNRYRIECFEHQYTLICLIINQGNKMQSVI